MKRLVCLVVLMFVVLALLMYSILSAKPNSRPHRIVCNVCGYEPDEDDVGFKYDWNKER